MEQTERSRRLTDLELMARTCKSERMNIGRIVARGTVIVGGAFWVVMAMANQTTQKYSNLIYDDVDVAKVLGSALVPLLNLTTVPLVSSLGAMPDRLPRPMLPDLSYALPLLPAAFALTIIALAQSAGISQAYINPDGKYPNPSRDFTGQGAANVAGALVQGLPAGGSLGGTQLIVKGGARSRWANMITAISAAIIILVFGDLIGKIALSALAGLLMVVGFQTIKFREISKIWRTSVVSRAFMIATFVATLIVPLQWAIFFGVALSFAIFAYRESESTTIVEVASHESGVPLEQPAPAVLPSNQVTLLNAYGNLFFAGARNLEEDLPQVEETHHAVVILSLRGHAELGSTFIGVLERYARALQATSNVLMLVSVNPAVYEQLKQTECLDVLGAENVFVDSKPGESTLKAFEIAQQLIQRGGAVH